MDLGYENVYHMDTIFTTSPQDSKAWTKAFEYKFQGKGKPFVKDDFDKLLCNFQVQPHLQPPPPSIPPRIQQRLHADQKHQPRP